MGLAPWLATAVRRIEADYPRSVDTHPIALPLPAFAAHGIDLYLKDESTHPTAASSIGSRARCSSMRWSTAGCAVRTLVGRMIEAPNVQSIVAMRVGDCDEAQRRIEAQLT